MIETRTINPDAIVEVKHKDLVALCVSVLESHLGLRLSLVKGGPSVTDPCGEVENYIGFRDKHGNGIAIAIDSSGRIRTVNRSY